MKEKNIYLNLRISDTLKADFDEFCIKAGIKKSVAIKMFITKCISLNKIPDFILTDITDNGFNGEVKKSCMSFRLSEESRNDFQVICDNIGVPMSVVVKLYMLKCLSTNSLPVNFD